jgi:uncharacterized membrane protein
MMKKGAPSKHQAKKNVVLQSKKQAIRPITLALGIAFLAGAVVTAFLITTHDPAGSQTRTAADPRSASSPAGAGEFSYPVSLFADGKARHFDHKAGGLTIRYFILKSADGVIRAAFDACDVCWPSGKGYFQEGDDMVCRNCGRRFASVLVNEVQGGCNPAPLNRTIRDDRVVINARDIEKGRTYFNFKEKV